MLPFWKVPGVGWLLPRQRKALQAVQLIRETTEKLIAKCKQMVDAEEQVGHWLQYHIDAHMLSLHALHASHQ